MKPSVTITLLIIGGALIAIPPFFNYLVMLEVVSLMKDGADRVTLAGEVSSEYSFGCWGVGGLMILAGISGALSGGKSNEP